MAKKVLEDVAGLSPEDLIEGGGLLDDEVVTITKSQFALFDYNGAIPTPIPTIEWAMETEDGMETTQNWSVGKAEDWVPSKDGKKPAEEGKYLKRTGKSTGIRSTSNGGILLTSLANAGYTDMGPDVSQFEGMVCHVIRVAAPKRSGLVRSEKKKEFEDSILTVDEIKSLPGKKGAAKGKASGGKQTSEDKKSVDNESTEDRATALVMGELAKNPDGVPKAALPAEIFKLLADEDPGVRNEVVQLVFSDEFLGDDNRPWAYSDGVVKLRDDIPS
jgi:hypothetical protein